MLNSFPVCESNDKVCPGQEEGKLYTLCDVYNVLCILPVFAHNMHTNKLRTTGLFDYKSFLACTKYSAAPGGMPWDRRRVSIEGG